MKHIKKNLIPPERGIALDCALIQVLACYNGSKTDPSKEAATDTCNKWCYF
ncbi:hypothetical protein [Chryseobacterium rhizosphaerae]|uniref:hypothetical protein n=1 Tax=Chryseobacterium rhizosphaerae TaxID=395937 RepID=UPI00130028F1|nr:hypothetical protein [Chryseobacterium rhizosphaerae]